MRKLHANLVSNGTSMIASMNNGDTMPLSHGGFGCKYTPTWPLLLGSSTFSLFPNLLGEGQDCEHNNLASTNGNTLLQDRLVLLA
jgi:hypothetical protein